MASWCFCCCRAKIHTIDPRLDYTTIFLWGMLLYWLSYVVFLFFFSSRSPLLLLFLSYIFRVPSLLFFRTCLCCAWCSFCLLSCCVCSVLSRPSHPPRPVPFVLLVYGWAKAVWTRWTSWAAIRYRKRNATSSGLAWASIGGREGFQSDSVM